MLVECERVLVGVWAVWRRRLTQTQALTRERPEVAGALLLALTWTKIERGQQELGRWKQR